MVGLQPQRSAIVGYKLPRGRYEILGIREHLEAYLHYITRAEDVGVSIYFILAPTSKSMFASRLTG